MSTEKALALVIRLVNFSESSQVVTFFTREFGKLGALAKGGRRLRGPTACALDLLSVCRIVLIRKHSGSLDLLTEAERVVGFAPQRNSLQVLYAGYYIAELLLELTHDDDPFPLLFDAARESLRDLESGGNCRLILRRFEFALLRETGHMPHLDGCVSCSRVLQGNSPVWFGVAVGGVLCGTCAATAGVTIRLSPGSVNVLRLVGSADGSPWWRLHLEPAVDREIRAVTRGAIRYLVGHELRTEPFLGDSPS